jgi:tetratricopeptide (TPR) repeat protein
MLVKRESREGKMKRNKLTVLCVFAAMLVVEPVVGHSAEELFDTKTATLHIEKGITHLKAKNYDAAIKEFEESSVINPDAEAFYYLGYAYYMKGKISNDSGSRKKAVENFDKAYELNPNFTPTRFKPEETVKPNPKKEKKEQPQTESQPEIPEAPADQTTEPAVQQPGN